MIDRPTFAIDCFSRPFYPFLGSSEPGSCDWSVGIYRTDAEKIGEGPHVSTANLCKIGSGR